MPLQELVADLTKSATNESRIIVEWLVRIIEGSGPPLDAAVKWRQLTFAQQGDFHHWICAIAVTKNGAALRFHFGGLLEDPEGVFKAGSSLFLRTIEYRTLRDVDEAVVSNLISQAVNRLEYFKQHWKELQKHKA